MTRPTPAFASGGPNTTFLNYKRPSRGGKTPALLVTSEPAACSSFMRAQTALRCHSWSAALPSASVPAKKRLVFGEAQLFEGPHSPSQAVNALLRTPSKPRSPFCWAASPPSEHLMSESPGGSPLAHSAPPFNPACMRTPPTVPRAHVLNLPPTLRSSMGPPEPLGAPHRVDRFRDFRRSDSAGSESDGDSSPRYSGGRVLGLRLGCSPLHRSEPSRRAPAAELPVRVLAEAEIVRRHGVRA